MEGPGEREREKVMRAVSLLYHDVVKRGESDASGFPGLHAGRYKLDGEEFEGHMAALHAAVALPPRTVLDVLAQDAGSPFMLTFDDGGISARHYVADVLDRYGWKAHFFITTDYIGHPAFVDKQHIRELRARGHAIGSHSRSHPPRMSYLTWDALVQEWKTSVDALADVLGEEVAIASVPGGYYATNVAAAASQCGIKGLFTSEPITRSHVVDGCRVFGRYTIWRGMASEKTARFATGRGGARGQQFLFWNAKKMIKAVGGRQYAKLIARLLERGNGKREPDP